MAWDARHVFTMSYALPLIRAAVIAPIRRWLSEDGRDPGPFLAQADLAWVPDNDPFMLIPLRNAVRLLVAIARSEGPDSPFRIVGRHSASELGLVSAAALRGPTLREGLLRVPRVMPQHSTHELFRVTEDEAGLWISDGWAIKFGEEESLHLTQQYVAALVGAVCSAAGGAGPALSHVAIRPHPEAGLTHLNHWLGDRVSASVDRSLLIRVDTAFAARVFPASIRTAAAAQGTVSWPQLDGDRSLTDDIAVLVASILPHRRPTLDQIAAAVGTSSRSLKRQLQAEGSSFSGILERTRAEISLQKLSSANPPTLKDLATELGYSDQATLTRAVRRWTGQTPSGLKARP